MTLSLLGQTKLEGTHFTDSQEKDKDCTKVSAIWTAQCMSFAEGQQKLAEQQKTIQDIKTPLRNWKTAINTNDEFCLEYKPTGRQYVPTEHCLTNLAYVGRTSSWMLDDLVHDKGHATKKRADGEPEIVFQRDRRDAELLCRIVDLTIFAADRQDQDKPRLFRTWDNGTLRALLSEEYAIVNNQWFMELIESLVPGGLLSHWRGDADTIFGNVLIPDSIRQEADSQYGGMLSIGNSEIGTRRYLSLPSVFRAICMNGCIWEQEKGKSVSGVHRGKLDYSKIGAEIAYNLQQQIPLVSAGIDKLLQSRSLVMGDVSYLPVFAEVFRQFKIAKAKAPKVLAAFNVERKILGDDVKTAFGVQAAITRAGQEFDNEVWVDFDKIGGQLAGLTPANWESIIKRASTLKAEDVAAVLGDVTHL